MFNRSKLDLAVATFTVAGNTLAQELALVKNYCDQFGTSDDYDAWEGCEDRVMNGVQAVSLEELPDIPALNVEEPEGLDEEEPEEDRLAHSESEDLTS